MKERKSLESNLEPDKNISHYKHFDRNDYLIVFFSVIICAYG